MKQIMQTVAAIALIMCMAPWADGASIQLPGSDGIPWLFGAGTGDGDAGYAFRYDLTSGTWHAANAGQHLVIQGVRTGEIVISGANGSDGFRLTGVGRNGNAIDTQPGSIHAEGNRLEIRHGTITEWYSNTAGGLEQGMTLTTAPEGTGQFRVDYTLSGDLRPAVIGGQVLIFSDRYGPVMIYGKLAARDSKGAILPSSMEMEGTRLSWLIDDHDAVYPVTIDPVVVSASVATASFTGGAKNSNFGRSIAVSSDGNRILVGSISNSSAFLNAGAAYLYNKPGGGWSGTIPTSAATARFTGGAEGDSFGNSVALSSDGTRALIGSPYNDTAGGNAGAAYLFVEPGGGWSGTTPASAATATFTGGGVGDLFGNVVALSQDGSRAMVGAYGNDTAGGSAGAAYLFVEPGGGWSGTTPASSATATFTGGRATDQFGGSVALSTDGNYALVGARYNTTGLFQPGAAYLFVEPGGGWSGTTPASSATAWFTGGSSALFGSSVALSPDGSRALVGAYSAYSSGSSGPRPGVAYMFIKPGGGWSGTTPASAANLTFTGGAESDLFGYSVALSSDGTHILAGAYYNKTAGNSAGAAYLFQPPYATLTAGGVTTGTAGRVVNGLTLNPSGYVTSADLFLGTSDTTPTGTAIKTGIASFSAGTATTVNGVNLAGKAPGTYYLILNQSGTTTILAATASAVYTVITMPDAPVVTGIAPAAGLNTSTVSVTIAGTGFNSNGTTIVSLNRTDCSNVTQGGVVVGSATSLTGTIPIHVPAGAWNVTVINNDGQAGSNATVTYNATEGVPPPTPTPTSPTIAPGEEGESSKPTSYSASASGVQAGETATFAINEPVSAADLVGITTVRIIPSVSLGTTSIIVADAGKIDTAPFSGRQVAGVKSIESVALNPSSISRGTISFAFAGSWMAGHGIKPDEIVIMRLSDAKWTEIPTVLDSSSADLYAYSATTPGFSYFAVVSRLDQVTTSNQTAAGPAQVPAVIGPAKESVKKDTPVTPGPSLSATLKRPGKTTTAPLPMTNQQSPGFPAFAVLAAIVVAIPCTVAIRCKKERR
jgi:PGF-pre-PGF domain-containing protein